MSNVKIQLTEFQNFDRGYGEVTAMLSVATRSYNTFEIATRVLANYCQALSLTINVKNEGRCPVACRTIDAGPYSYKMADPHSRRTSNDTILAFAPLDTIHTDTLGAHQPSLRTLTQCLSMRLTSYCDRLCW